MFYYLGCTFCISYLYAILYIHALMLNDMKKKCMYVLLMRTIYDWPSMYV